MSKSIRLIVIAALALAGAVGMVALAGRLERDRARIEVELQSLRPTEAPTPQGDTNEKTPGVADTRGMWM